MIKPTFVLAVFLVGPVACSGCGRTEPQRPSYPVLGRVTHKGSPLPVGMIQFKAQGALAPLVRGAYIKDGTYEMPGDQGLPAGTYVVEINNTPPGPSAVPVPPLPAEYHGKSKLTATVASEKENVFNFDLK